MKRSMLLGGVVGCALLWSVMAEAETLRITCSAPLQNNSGSCVSPTLITASTLDSLWVIFKITGPNTARRDSVWRRPGGAITLSYNLPPGTYTVVAIGARRNSSGVMLYGCPAQSTNSTQTGMPWRPTFGP